MRRNAACKRDLTQSRLRPSLRQKSHPKYLCRSFFHIINFLQMRLTRTRRTCVRCNIKKATQKRQQSRPIQWPRRLMTIQYAVSDQMSVAWSRQIVCDARRSTSHNSESLSLPYILLITLGSTLFELRNKVGSILLGMLGDMLQLESGRTPVLLTEIDYIHSLRKLLCRIQRD